MPSTEEELLLFLGVEELFTKQCIYWLRYNEFAYKEKVCSVCRSTDRNSIAYNLVHVLKVWIVQSWIAVMVYQ
jgi:hypothetical protein